MYPEVVLWAPRTGIWLQQQSQCRGSGMQELFRKFFCFLKGWGQFYHPEVITKLGAELCLARSAWTLRVLPLEEVSASLLAQSREQGRELLFGFWRASKRTAWFMNDKQLPYSRLRSLRDRRLRILWSFCLEQWNMDVWGVWLATVWLGGHGLRKV